MDKGINQVFVTILSHKSFSGTLTTVAKSEFLQKEKILILQN